MFSRTLIADVAYDRRCGRSKAMAGYKIFTEALSLLTPFDLGRPLSDSDTKEFVTYRISFGAACVNRSFIATRKGRVGLGPSHSQPGDKIILIPNSPWPFIIRRKETTEFHADESKPTYEFLGDSYVHGIMDGELMQHAKPDQSEEFELN